MFTVVASLTPGHSTAPLLSSTGTRILVVADHGTVSLVKFSRPGNDIINDVISICHDRLVTFRASVQLDFLLGSVEDGLWFDERKREQENIC